ncbi:MAG: prepilin-type N-terminal cleavage/methylation domain-containing protein, partial [Kofleriaceae bacterium]|nr:prepilin-type N-terminal cleavage/methylation domain-containing protein [Kofleriaceae bacterium]
MEQRSGEQGFTIVELMVVVAIIAVLAAIVVPTFTKESKKSKAKSEVGAMFAELGVR